MKTQEERKCKCCNKIIPEKEIKRENIFYCKSCKKHHKNLYAKWNMREKREEHKKRRLSKRMKKEGVVEEIADKVNKSMTESFKKDKWERDMQKIMDDVQKRNNYSILK